MGVNEDIPCFGRLIGMRLTGCLKGAGAAIGFLWGLSGAQLAFAGEGRTRGPKITDRVRLEVKIANYTRSL